MTFESAYKQAKSKLLHGELICPENLDLFRRFFEYLEYKLKRVNGLSSLDESAYRTLLVYIHRLRTVNRWFDNKPWIHLTKEDIKHVYDAVEDGTICTSTGRPYRDANSYFRKVMRSKPFEMAGKKDLVVHIMEFHRNRSPDDVRFIREDTFRQLVNVAGRPDHKAALWLAWDIGENMSSLLRLLPRDVTRVINPDTKSPEYHINLRREILKRSRTPRTELTNYGETVACIDELLAATQPDQPLFSFGYAAAVKFLRRTVRITGARCIPGGQPVTLKDLRSSMACDLLSKGWTTDEVNQRLGHKPSSREIDKYVNWLALGRHRPKRRLHDNHVDALSREIQELKDRETLSQQRLRVMQNQVEQLQAQLEANNRLMYEQVRRLVNETRNSESSRRASKAG